MVEFGDNLWDDEIFERYPYVLIPPLNTKTKSLWRLTTSVERLNDAYDVLGTANC